MKFILSGTLKTRADERQVHSEIGHLFKEYLKGERGILTVTIEEGECKQKA